MGSSSEARRRIDTKVLMVAAGGEGGARAPSDLDWYTALPDAALRTLYEVRPDVVLTVLGDALVELDRRNHLVVAGGRSVKLTPSQSGCRRGSERGARGAAQKSISAWVGAARRSRPARAASSITNA